EISDQTTRAEHARRPSGLRRLLPDLDPCQLHLGPDQLAQVRCQAAEQVAEGLVRAGLLVRWPHPLALRPRARRSPSASAGGGSAAVACLAAPVVNGGTGEVGGVR